MSPDIEGLVQTSTNLATIAKKDGAIEIWKQPAQCDRIEQAAAAKMVRTACELAGFEATSSGGYPDGSLSRTARSWRNCRKST